MNTGPRSSSSTIMNRPVRRHIVLTGILQGIGCRPTIFRLATRIGLSGWVINTTSCVRMEIEGSREQCDRFEAELPGEIPFPGRIDGKTVREVAPVDDNSFSIQTSEEDERSITPIPPDVAVCPECVTELFDPADGRYLYPFITCTLCGPRFTVVRSFPYDRERTSMADFVMCPQCEKEYGDPADRRFHSQTNSCPVCGPTLTLTDREGRAVPGDPIVTSIDMLREGKVLAVKGIGGFHLACNALDPDAVDLLRERKGRRQKPFAVMMPDVQTVDRYCRCNDEELELLRSPVAPIVLMQAKGPGIAPNVSPGIDTIGVMLPYSPIHHVLFRHPEALPENRPEVLVMTSGNLAEEPIVRGNQEAYDRLAELADAFLLHNREIMLRADDSIFRVIAGRKTVFRRSRGIVPAEIVAMKPHAPQSQEELEQSDASSESLATEHPVILGAGGDLKNSLVIVKEERAVPGPHVGDLASPVAQAYFEKSISVLSEYLEAAPELIALDPHPEYFSNMLAREMGPPVEEVYHHHAHAVSLLSEHGLDGPALFAVFDGTGFGTDGSIWGGEFLKADRVSFERLAHIGSFALPGGETAIKEPWRIMAALLAEERTMRVDEDFHPLIPADPHLVDLWMEAVRKRINAPMTSSAGRLFDAASAAAGFNERVTFEGQAAMWLEGIADRNETGVYPIRFRYDTGLTLDPAALILETARDMLAGSSPAQVAARFHNTMAEAVAEMLSRLADEEGIDLVGLSGGCFQNRLFTEKAVRNIKKKGLRILLHESVPPNDGGIALGQAVCALDRFRRRND